MYFRELSRIVKLNTRKFFGICQSPNIFEVLHFINLLETEDCHHDAELTKLLLCCDVQKDYQKYEVTDYDSVGKVMMFLDRSVRPVGYCYHDIR